ncbi:MAG: hypothetical protein AB8H80_00210 [Planctomycetota bacterium]
MNTKTKRSELEDRLLDTMLHEVEGRQPAADLVARTLARIEEPALPIGPERRQPSSLLWIAAALAVCVVTTLAVWVPSRSVAVAFGSSAADESAGATIDSDASEAARAVRGTRKQDPVAVDYVKRIAALADPAKRRTAVRTLARGGKPALAAMIAALADEKAPRQHVLEALHAMHAGAASALPVVIEILNDTPVHDVLMESLFRTVATLAPFGTDEQREEVRRAVLLKEFVRDARAVGPGVKPRQKFRSRDIARLLHRLEIPRDATKSDLLGFLGAESPYTRELAAYHLRNHSSPDVCQALYAAIVGKHPSRIEVAWALKEGVSGSFQYSEEHDLIIRIIAARSLVQIAGSDPVSARAHAILLDSAGLAEQRRAASALARIAIEVRDLEAVRKSLKVGLTGDDSLLLRELTVVAGHLPDLSSELRAALVRLSKHEDRQVAAGAVAALRVHR